MTKDRAMKIFILSITVFVFCVCICFFNFKPLKSPIFRRKTTFSEVTFAKYEQDGNIYVVDSGSFRLTCMTPQGNINYTISIDKIKDYSRIYDIAVDENGNLYAHTMELAYDEDAKTKDAIVKYNKKGKFVRTILEIPYEKENPNRTYAFPQFGSLRYENSILTFSHVQKEGVELYRYDT